MKWQYQICPIVSAELLQIIVWHKTLSGTRDWSGGGRFVQQFPRRVVEETRSGRGREKLYKCRMGVELGVKIARTLTECLCKIKCRYAGMLCVTHQQDILIKQLAKVVSPEEKHFICHSLLIRNKVTNFIARLCLSCVALSFLEPGIVADSWHNKLMLSEEHVLHFQWCSQTDTSDQVIDFIDADFFSL